MKLGIIGLSGAGKSTLFEALTKIILDEASHKPEDRLGTITVPDERVDKLRSMYTPKKTIYAQVEYLLPTLLHKNQDTKATRQPGPQYVPATP